MHFRDGKKAIHRISKKGTALDTCATYNTKYICCRIHVLKSVHNCPFDCSYCFLQNYLTDGSTKIVDDIDMLMKEVRERIAREPFRFFRIGTWELGDSLALEERTGQAAQLIKEFALLDNAILELKTKSDQVDSILACDHGHKTVVSWSLNTEHIIKGEENGTASLQKRIKAMEKTARAGYLIGLHFDPMIWYDSWEKDYTALVRQVFDTVNPDRIVWVSIGSLRFNPEMKKKIENNHPESRLTCAEMVAGDDAKVRYVKPLRVRMYRHLKKELETYLTGNSLLYLCMERWDVWEKVFGYYPLTAADLDYLFARSIYQSHGLGSGAPDRAAYDNPLTVMTEQKRL